MINGTRDDSYKYFTHSLHPLCADVTGTTNHHDWDSSHCWSLRSCPSTCGTSAQSRQKIITQLTHILVFKYSLLLPPSKITKTKTINQSINQTKTIHLYIAQCNVVFYRKRLLEWKYIAVPVMSPSDNCSVQQIRLKNTTVKFW